MSHRARNLIIAIPIICLFFAIALPNFIKGRVGTSKNSCINILRQVEGAKDQWMSDQHKTTNDAPTWADLRPYLRPEHPECPEGGSYTIGKMAELPTCSIARHTEYWRTNHP